MSTHDHDWNNEKDEGEPDDVSSPVDQLVVLQAEIDQMVAIAPEMARAARGVFNAYVEEGFTETQALYLTVAQTKDSPGQAP